MMADPDDLPPPPTLDDLSRRLEASRKRARSLKAEAEQLVEEAEERRRRKSESE